MHHSISPNSCQRKSGVKQNGVVPREKPSVPFLVLLLMRKYNTIHQLGAQLLPAFLLYLLLGIFKAACSSQFPVSSQFKGFRPATDPYDRLKTLPIEALA